MKVKDKVVLVTGASAGIGRAVAIELVNRGAKVVGIDINSKGLDETKNLIQDKPDDFISMVGNIADPDALNSIREELIRKGIYIDGYMNIAGIIQPFIHVKDLPYDRIERVINVNLYGTIYLYKTFINDLLQKNEAHILHIGSMGGFIPVPGQSIYGATKAAVHLMTQGIRAELKDTNVKVTLVMPGSVETEITKNSDANIKIRSDKPIKQMKMLSKEKAAHLIINAMERDRIRVTAGSDARMMDLMSRWMPIIAANLIQNKMKDL